MIKYVRLALFTLFFGGLTAPAWACLSCGCGSTGSAADLGAIGGASSLFADGHHWLLQTGTSWRQISGSFNEQGTWNPTPVGASLQSYQASLGLMYFPVSELALGLQMPLQGNRLDAATWGSFGSIAPSDQGPRFGGGLGDLQFQGSYRFWGYEDLALAGWGNLTLPTGQVDAAQAAATTGSGQTSLSGGVMALYSPMPPVVDLSHPDLGTWLQTRNWEFFLNLGYAQALGQPPAEASPFFQGQSVLYQLQTNVTLGGGWMAGLGLNGQLGSWSAGSGGAQWASRLKLLPALQYAFSEQQGLRLALGYDLPFWGANQLTDTSLYLVFYSEFAGFTFNEKSVG